MVTKFLPESNKVYFINQNTLIHVLEGSGTIEVDFKNYFDWDQKLIFLEKGQYLKFLSNSFVVRKIVFKDEKLFKGNDVRVLFKHLVSLGYINYQECTACQLYLSDTLFSSPKDILDVSVNQWFWQNPFKADKEEYQIIFDLKDVIDEQFRNHISSSELVKSLDINNVNLHYLVKDKIGLTIKRMLSKKQLLESQKEIAFTDKPIQTIAYDFGYKDPAYFNRVFKKEIGVTPNQFRDKMGFQLEDTFEQELFDLIQEFHTQQRELSFYADKMCISEKTLSKKVREKLNKSIGQLIRQEVLKTSKQYLSEGRKVKEIALSLGFEEANHFSSFFKRYEHKTPTTYFLEKCN